MMKTIRHSALPRILSLLMLAIITATFVMSITPSDAYATVPVTTPPVTPGTPSTPGEIFPGCPDSGKLIAKVVPCVRAALIRATTAYNKEISDVVFPIVTIVLTLMVALYGLSVLRGEGELTKKAMIFLLKAVAVLAFTSELGGRIPDIYNIMDNLQEFTTSGLSYSLGSAKCPDVATFDNTATPVSPLWVNLDCIAGKLFGLGDNFVLASSVFGILGAAVFSGTVGVMIFFGGIMTLASVIFIVVRAVFTYLITYVYVSFMIIISPIFIPMLAGSGQIYEVFDRWAKGLMSGMIMPVFMFAYMTLALGIVDEVMFGSPGPALGMSGSFQEIIDPNQDSYAGELMQKCDKTLLKQGDWARKAGVALDNSFKDGETVKNPVTGFFTGSANLCQLQSHLLEFNHDDMIKILFDLIKIAIIIWLLAEALEKVMDMAQQVLMGGFALVSAVEKTNIVEASVAGGLDSAKRTATNELRDMGVVNSILGGNKVSSEQSAASFTSAIANSGASLVTGAYRGAKGSLGGQ